MLGLCSFPLFTPTSHTPSFPSAPPLLIPPRNCQKLATVSRPGSPPSPLPAFWLLPPLPRVVSWLPLDSLPLSFVPSFTSCLPRSESIKLVVQVIPVQLQLYRTAPSITPYGLFSLLGPPFFYTAYAKIQYKNHLYTCKTKQAH